mmetsp:Transcript_33179/g.78697  ORF Transcript_33179/g.78697 Transcript_33179/m.78697 type:complete len:130 (+) Transcript_33179:99-488(+)
MLSTKSTMSLGSSVRFSSGASRVSGTSLSLPSSVTLPSSNTLRCPVRMAQSLQGKVVSTKGDLTVVVAVDRYVPHQKYQKRCRDTKRYKVHAPQGVDVVDLGDFVEINPCRPISKSKSFALGKIIKKRG